MNQLYTTPEASKATGIPEGTIRSWLSRHAGLFQVDVHIVIEESGRKLWTEEGINLLRSRCGESPTATQTDAQPDAMMDALLQTGARQYAYKYFQLLPVYTLQQIRRMTTSPTDEERELINQSVQEAIGIGTFELLPNYIKGVLGEAES